MTDTKIIKAVVKGLLTFIPGVAKALDNKKKTSKHSGSHAEFCYTLWLSLLVHFRELGLKPNMRTIGEIGSGGSLGVGLCALLTGSDKYYAFETDAIFDVEQNLKMLEELIQLFQNKTDIPDKYSQLNIKVNNFGYPADIIQPVFFNERILEEIRNDIKNAFVKSNRIQIIRNWEQHPALNLDFIFSRAVMEHVASPAKVYKGIESHLKAGSIMLHDIEFHSHGISKRIDGHYLIPGYLWKIIFGRRLYFLNRWSLNDHVKSIIDNGFEIIKIDKNLINDSNKNAMVMFGAVILAKK